MKSVPCDVARMEVRRSEREPVSAELAALPVAIGSRRHVHGGWRSGSCRPTCRADVGRRRAYASRGSRLPAAAAVRLTMMRNRWGDGEQVTRLEEEGRGDRRRGSGRRTTSDRDKYAALGQSAVDAPYRMVGAASGRW
jgi:hypothetical protein